MAWIAGFAACWVQLKPKGTNTPLTTAVATGYDPVMSIRKLKLRFEECTCERCGATWIAEPVLDEKTGKWVSIVPKSCAKCKSKYWNSPRKTE